MFDFNFGSNATTDASINLPHPWIDGQSCESWQQTGSAQLLSDRITVADGCIEKCTAEIYRRMFAQIPGRAIYRVWNYVPSINAPLPGNIPLDQYMGFCLGRGQVMADMDIPFGAASAVGSPGNELIVVMLHGTGSVEPLENPQQVPAYRYPQSLPRPRNGKCGRCPRAAPEWKKYR